MLSHVDVIPNNKKCAFIYIPVSRKTLYNIEADKPVQMRSFSSHTKHRFSREAVKYERHRFDKRYVYEQMINDIK